MTYSQTKEAVKTMTIEELQNYSGKHSYLATKELRTRTNTTSTVVKEVRSIREIKNGVQVYEALINGSESIYDVMDVTGLSKGQTVGTLAQLNRNEHVDYVIVDVKGIQERRYFIK